VNTIGTAFRITLFGTSHGPCVGCVVDGIPPGLEIDQGLIRSRLMLRRPVEGIGTPRREEDVPEITGTVDGITTGAPLLIVIHNRDVDSGTYQRFRRVPRPGHADFTALHKYGKYHDLRGGGQFSGRMTVPLVVAGALAEMLLREMGVLLAAYTQSIGEVEDREEHTIEEIHTSRESNPMRAASPQLAVEMERETVRAREDGDSVGGVVRCIAEGLPVGVGEPFFDTLEGEIAKMIFAIPAVKGIEFGSGFMASRMRGSEHNDPFVVREGRVVTATNHAGGALGGLSIGMPLDFRVAFKPTASISRRQTSVDLVEMREVPLVIEGRHDPCIVPRAVVVVETLTAAVLVDLAMRGGFLG